MTRQCLRAVSPSDLQLRIRTETFARDHIENFLAAAELTSIEGKLIGRAISSWVDNFKRPGPNP